MLGIAAYTFFLLKICFETSVEEGPDSGGQRGQLPRAPRCKGAPRDEICLFQLKYSFEIFS